MSVEDAVRCLVARHSPKPREYTTLALMVLLTLIGIHTNAKVSFHTLCIILTNILVRFQKLHQAKVVVLGGRMMSVRETNRIESH